MAGEKHILELIASGALLPAVLEALVRLIEERVPEMLGSILLLDEAGKRLLHGAAPSLPERYNRAINGLLIGPDVGSCGTAAYRKKAVIVSDVASNPLWTNYRALALEHGLRACWSTPIFSRSGKVLGTFAMYYRERRSPSRSDLELIQTAAHLAGIAIERAQTEKLLQRNLDSLQALFKINRDVASILDLDTLLPRMAEEARKILNTDYGYFRLLEGDQLVPRAFSGPEHFNLLPVNRHDDCFAADILRENRAVILHRPGDPREPNENGKMLVKAGYHSFLGVPMRVRNRIIGTAHLGSKKHREFSAGEIRLMEAFADQAAIAIHNSQLYEAILHQAMKLAAANEHIARANIELEAEIAERKRLEKEVLQIGTKERERIGQDLHDGLGQELTGIAFLAKGLEEKLRKQSLAAAAEAAKIAGLVNDTIGHTRALARGLFPVPVEANGLMSALEELAGSVQSMFRISCKFDCDEPVLLTDNNTATLLYRIAQEAVDNAVRHGRAKRIAIHLSHANDTGLLSVADDGAGISETGDRQQGLGLRIMRHRAEMIRGSLEIHRNNGGGTIVLCSFPFSQPPS